MQYFKFQKPNVKPTLPNVYFYLFINIFITWEILSGSTGTFEQLECKPFTDGKLGTCPLDASWTEWFNEDGPSGDGDDEKLSALLKKKKACPWPRAMQVLTTDNTSYKMTKQRVSLDFSKGFRCENQDGRKCSDYKVRYCCASPAKNIFNEVGKNAGFSGKRPSTLPSTGY